MQSVVVVVIPMRRITLLAVAHAATTVVWSAQTPARAATMQSAMGVHVTVSSVTATIVRTAHPRVTTVTNARARTVCVPVTVAQNRRALSA